MRPACAGLARPQRVRAGNVAHRRGVAARAARAPGRTGVETRWCGCGGGEAGADADADVVALIARGTLAAVCVLLLVLDTLVLHLDMIPPFPVSSSPDMYHASLIIKHAPSSTVASILITVAIITSVGACVWYTLRTYAARYLGSFALVVIFRSGPAYSAVYFLLTRVVR